MTPDEQKIQTSAGMETANETVARARKMLEPTVSANDLANPPAKVNPPAPKVNTNDGSATSGIVDNTTQNTQDFITSASENARKRDELATMLGSQTVDGSAQRTQLQEQFQMPENLARLQDIQTQLAKRNEQSAMNKATAVSGGAGASQAQRALTLEDRQNAIRNAGLAAEANILQDNIETASTLISQAMTDYYSDRQINNQNMIQQLEYYSGLADEETAQMLKKEQRKYEEDQRQIIRAESTVDAAMTSGYASPEDIKKLTSLSGDPVAQTAYAQQIVANAARQAVAIERQKLANSMANSDLARKSALYELAMLGDPDAIAELGFDPTEPATQDEIKKIDNTIEDIKKKQTDVIDLLSNKIGMQSSTGEWQFGEATFRGLTGQGVQETTNIPLPNGQIVPFNTSPMGLSGIAKARQQKSTFLAKADRLLTEEGLAQIGNLAEQGIKLNPLANMETQLLMASASILNASAIRKEGKLQGFTIPDTEVEKELQTMFTSMDNLILELEANKNLPSNAYAELEARRQSLQQ